MRNKLGILIQEPMSRPRIDNQLRIRDLGHQFPATRRLDQEIVITIHDQDRHLQLSQAIVRVPWIRHDKVRVRRRLPLRAFFVEKPRHDWLPLDTALEHALPVRLGSRTTKFRVRKERECQRLLGIRLFRLRCEHGNFLGRGLFTRPHDARDVGVGAREGRRRAGEDKLADQMGRAQGDHLHRAAAHGEAEEVDLSEAERGKQGEDVVGPALECICDGAGAAAYAGLVEDEDAAMRAEGVEEEGILWGRVSEYCKGYDSTLGRVQWDGVVGRTSTYPIVHV
jgi:hypothetical protein